MTTESTKTKGLEWKWIVVGVIAGTFLTLLLHKVMALTFHTATVPMFMSLLGFAVMGIIIGFKSQGYTIIEPAVGGILTAVIVGIVLVIYGGVVFSSLETYLAPVVGFVFGLLGGWVGEELHVPTDVAQHQIEEEKKGKLQWAWIAVGTVLAFILSNFFVFGGFAILKFGIPGIFVSLGFSFFIAGLLTGYFSPGITIKESAIAGVFSMILNYILLLTLFSVTFKEMGQNYTVIIETLFGGFILALIGGWVGEKIQSFMEDRPE